VRDAITLVGGPGGTGQFRSMTAAVTAPLPASSTMQFRLRLAVADSGDSQPEGLEARSTVARTI
jgi:hypothetical protein